MQDVGIQKVVVGALLAMSCGATVADSVVDMCLDLDRPDDVCPCAAAALRDEVGEDAYTTYEAVGVVYRENQAAGQGRSDAWTAALDSVGVSLRDTNPVGAAHRKAMKGCGG